MMLNTYERHKLYLLERERKKRLRKRVFSIILTIVFFLSTWSLLSYSGLGGTAVPPPTVMAKRILSRVLRLSSGVMDTAHRFFFPLAAEETRKQARSLFPYAKKKPDMFTKLSLFREEYAGEEADHTISNSLDILFIGIDSRIGQLSKRADALQLITIHKEGRSISITGIPRGTPTHLGYSDDSQNIMANVLTARNRDDLLRRVAVLTGRDSVVYWVEIGFSDAMGIIELLGYPDPANALQTLRRRKGYRYGDHTRSYTQAAFIGNAIRQLLPMLGEAAGETIIAQGLRMFHSNLTVKQCHGLALLLRDAGLADHPELLHISVHSPYARYLAADAAASKELHNSTSTAVRTVGQRLSALLSRSRSASDVETVRLLMAPFHQHIWLQIPDVQERRSLRDTMATRLANALQRLGRDEDVTMVHRTIQAENLLQTTMDRTKQKPVTSGTVSQ